MTNEEAIRNIKMHIAEMMVSLQDTDEHLEAEQIAIEALEKQIPKTPKIFKDIYMQPDYLCPVCDADVDTEWDYCAGCGQALNWEGVFE